MFHCYNTSDVSRFELREITSMVSLVSSRSSYTSILTKGSPETNVAGRLLRRKNKIVPVVGGDDFYASSGEVSCEAGKSSAAGDLSEITPPLDSLSENITDDFKWERKQVPGPSNVQDNLTSSAVGTISNGFKENCFPGVEEDTDVTTADESVSSETMEQQSKVSQSQVRLSSPRRIRRRLKGISGKILGCSCFQTKD